MLEKDLRIVQKCMSGVTPTQVQWDALDRIKTALAELGTTPNSKSTKCLGTSYIAQSVGRNKARS